MANLITKATRAISSRMFPQKADLQFSRDRLAICKTCFYNSLNFETYTAVQKVKLNLNKVLNFIFRVDQFKGVCLHPECGCDLIKKSQYLEEECPDGKWGEVKEDEEYKSIYISNKK